uniref:M23 family metallopeptidase n=1 Tax=candidate division WOR-3 bacterium TaxID=2052148 RepID=A0A7C3YPU6_UNCW3
MTIFLFFLCQVLPPEYFWPISPPDSVHPLGNNWGNFQNYGSGSYFHNGIDIITPNQQGAPVYAVAKGWVKAWLTIQADYHWRLAISDSNLNFTGRAPGWLYAHIDPNRYHKQEGDSVLPGELIGYLVPWPVSGFDHIHFARISDTGRLWRRGSSQPQNPTWWFIQNPLTLIQPNTDTVPPTFEPARTGQLFAFCRNNSSTYLDPQNLSGDVDIIARIYDKTGFSTGNSTWDKLAPYKIEYSISGPRNLPQTLSVIFKYDLFSSSDTITVKTVYKRDATCRSQGDYNAREYFFIITNTDGDSLIERADTSGKWRTQEFPDGNYWVKVRASDVAGNWRAESMQVRTNNGVGITESEERIERGVKETIRIYDALGRIVSSPAIFPERKGVFFIVKGKEVRKKLLIK